MKPITLAMLGMAINLAIYALLVKFAIWAVASCNGPVLPFLPVFIGVIVFRLLFGRRG